MSSKDIEVGEDPQRMRPSDIPSAVGDNSAIRNAIGWQPGIDLQETLATLLDYWRAEVKEAR